MGCKCTKFLSPTKVNPAEISVEPPVRIVSRNPVNQYNGYGKRPAKEPAVRSRSGVAVNVKHHQDEVPSTHVIHSMLTFERSDAKRRESIDSTLSEESPESNRSTSPSDSSSTDIDKPDRLDFDSNEANRDTAIVSQVDQYYPTAENDADSIASSSSSSRSEADTNSKPVNDRVDIVNADSEAFTTSFLRQRQAAIDQASYRSQMKAWSPKSLQQLTELIRDLSKTRPLIDQFWIVFYWIACNIEYDAVSFLNNTIPVQSPESVFRTRKGVCAGYSNLYKYLCDQLNIKCEEVSGYAKGYGFDDRQADSKLNVDHAWNAVQIEEHWYLLDSTWGAGHLNTQCCFERKLNCVYFLMRPDWMIFSHLPETPTWQLLREPISTKQYMQMPCLKSNYFDLNLEMITPLFQAHATLVHDESYALIVIRAPDDVELIANLELNGNTIEGGHRVVHDAENRLYRCYFAPASIGKHVIHIFGRRINSKETSYPEVVKFPLEINEMPTHPLSYPKTSKKFYELGLKLISPVDQARATLVPDKSYALIVIRAPDDVELIANLKLHGNNIEGGHRVLHDAENHLYRCYFAPVSVGNHMIHIFGKRINSKEESYPEVVSFPLEINEMPAHPVSYPNVSKKFYELGLKVISPVKTHLIQLNDEETHARIVIQAPDNVELIGSLKNKDEQKVEGGEQVYYNRPDDRWICKFAPDQNGLFEASIFGKKKSDTGTYPSVVTFKIQATQLPSPALSYPKTWAPFHDLQLKIVAPMTSLDVPWPDNASFAEILVKAPDDVQLSCSLEQNGAKVTNGDLAQFDVEKRLWQLLFAPEWCGRHKLTVFAKRNGEGTSQCAVQFNLNVTRLPRSIKFPTVYDRFQATKSRICEPMNGVLKRNAIVPIHCLIPGASAVSVGIDGTLTKPEGYVDPVLKRQVTVGTSDVTIYAQYGNESNYQGLVRYSVQ